MGQHGGTPLNDASSIREDALRRELESVREHLTMVEAERDELARQNSELFILQQVFSAINSTIELDDILSMVMRGIREALGYQRVVLLDVEGAIVTPRMATEPDGRVTQFPRPQMLDLEPSSPLLAVATGEFELFVAQTSLPPLTDGSTFCLVPLVAREAIRGVIFVDGLDKEITDDSVRVLLDFASQAAMAVESARLFQETKRLAMVDHLTGLANARRLHDRMEHALAVAKRHSQPLCFVIMDLDDLKRINDSRGHAAGDAALRTFAETLKATARASDIVARYAGDEFVLVMPQTRAKAGMRAVERVLAALNARGIGASAGLAVYPVNAADEQGLFLAADGALYRAKVGGKNRCAVALPVG
ncbi:GGDEF domain-containing protein [bacterium]|nr:MAG: GGDEF domain-containing protein [bacterium]